MKVKDIILSIIIPVYNTEKYIRECLDSLVNQDLSCCEIICVDDGSTDSSSTILDEYKLRFPQYISVYKQVNQGQSVARNLGIDKAKGEYIAFLDSDDYYLPNAITQIKELIIQHSPIDVFYIDCAVTTQGERYFTIPFTDYKISSLVDYYDWEYNNYNSTPVGCVWGGIYSRTFLNKNNIRMFPKVYYEDELFMYNIFLSDGNVVALHINAPYYYYRTDREGSTVTSVKKKNFIDRITITREMNSMLQNSTYISESRKHKIFIMYLQNIIESYQKGFIDIVSKNMTKQDIVIMGKGIISTHEKKLMSLLKISFSLMAAYKTNNLPNPIRRCINILIK